jgi:hypothetical protein
MIRKKFCVWRPLMACEYQPPDYVMQPKWPIIRGKACAEALECFPADILREAATILLPLDPFLFLNIFPSPVFLLFVQL